LDWKGKSAPVPQQDKKKKQRFYIYSDVTYTHTRHPGAKLFVASVCDERISNSFLTSCSFLIFDFPALLLLILEKEIGWLNYIRINAKSCLVFPMIV